MELHFGGKKLAVGKDRIRTSDGAPAGTIELHGSKGSVYVLDEQDYVLFRAFCERRPKRWSVLDDREELVGTLRMQPGLLRRRVFEYNTYANGVYRIEGIRGERGYRVEGPDTSFFLARRRHWWKMNAYTLDVPETGAVTPHEWAAVAMGIEVLRERSLIWADLISGVLN
ncbi:hypothetical protein QWJ34_00510 [Saccharibacillus sp. CPCC 101409]|uniref:hypothetical protein n=1 Tax=Saccharibacillus sp. CPCC 101409 TaxID=3058041 RepID=UPI002673F4F5|nr:hypothetical protein [Saccharibacillus sp. CPCC 101409]MDO3408239.1 hypothetical protein [Saccharibacillus sp. CPCC 101409]